jgi:hypothetical protein
MLAAVRLDSRTGPWPLPSPLGATNALPSDWVWILLSPLNPLFSKNLATLA